MPKNSNSISRFWQELKRRNVVRVITVYAGAAFVIIELINNITEPLRLPEWTPTLVIVLLAIGFPVIIIISWIYDVHPEEGIVKTEPATEVSERAMPSSSSWKIASYISFVVIVGLIVLNVLPRTGKKENLEKSIAILPVRNLGGDPAQDPICAGLTSEIISQLAKIKSFDKIVPFQSVMNIEADQDVLDIAEELGVNYILGITYLKLGDKFRVNFLLIEPRDDNTIWQDDYERKYEEIISINTEIALEIARKLKTKFSKEEEERIENVRTTQNLEAYELIQSIVYEASHYNRNWDYKDSLKKVIDLDPEWAEPWAVMASFSILQTTDYKIPGFNELDAIEYNQKALALDQENLTVLFNQAIIEIWWNWNYIAAQAYYRRAFTIAPNTTHQYLIENYIEFLVQMKRYEEIPSYFVMMSEIDEWEMYVYALLGQQEKAEDAVQGMIEEGRYWPVVIYYIWRGEYERASTFVDEFSLENKVWNDPAHAYMAIVLYMTGDISGAEDLIKVLKERSETANYGLPEFNLARYYSVTGDTESAFKYLYQAYDEKFWGMGWLKADPEFENLRKDDRYRDLYAKVGLKDYDDYMANRKE